jgi:hypothetical protein
MSRLDDKVYKPVAINTEYEYQVCTEGLLR